MNARVATILACWAVFIQVCHGHGIRAVRIDGVAGVEATYDDGAPVSFSEVKVYAPGVADKPALTGATDRNGRFMFRPDSNGVWKVAVDDGMGHAAAVEVAVGAQGARHSSAPAATYRVHGVITGLSLIFGVAGWSAFLRMKRCRSGET